jgi:uncharacterized protein
MISLIQIESDLKDALKARDQIKADTLRGLKSRIQNEKIAKTRELSEEDILALIRSEVKRRKEAAQAYKSGGRQELAEKETLESSILEKYLPKQISAEELSALVDKFLEQNSFTAKDFGSAMGKLKAQLGSSADGAAMAKVLKEKLK